MSVYDDYGHEQYLKGNQYWNEGDYYAAVACFQRAGDDPHAQYMLGRAYDQGKGIAHDPRLAVFFFQKAADQGLAAAQIAVGTRYAIGKGIERDPEEAVRYLKMAADQGNADGLWLLGAQYMRGDGMTKNARKAYELFRRSAQLGSATGQHYLASCYEYGFGVEQDLDMALYYYELAVKKDPTLPAPIDDLRQRIALRDARAQAAAQEAEDQANIEAEEALDSVQKADEADSVPLPPKDEAPSLDEALAELNALVGLQGVKDQVRRLVNRTKVNQARRARGMAVPNTTNHCVFTGNPGTGKTTVARIMAKIYRSLGVVTKGQLVETDRSDLVGEYIGQTALKTKAVIEEALGGVLFIDEAYTLAGKGSRDFGTEAIETLLKMMEDHRDDLVVIAAGYEKEMDDFIGANPGLESRFQNFIAFEDYDADELLRIFEGICERNGFELSRGAEGALRGLFAWVVNHKSERFANGREARKVFDWAVEAQADRLAESLETLDDVDEKTLTTITEADIAAAGARLT